jgi:hypothetical protein
MRTPRIVLTLVVVAIVVATGLLLHFHGSDVRSMLTSMHGR